jgi:hypothetical protein
MFSMLWEAENCLLKIGCYLTVEAVYPQLSVANIPGEGKIYNLMGKTNGEASS